ncbi:MAG: hypothetical protein AABZ53_02780 [Planctomycetota bacterium]
MFEIAKSLFMTDQPMKLFVNLAAVVCAASFGGYMGWQKYQKHMIAEGERQCLQSLSRIRQEIKARAALASSELSPRGWPMTLRSEWFGEENPTNPLLPFGKEWIEIALPSEEMLTHPSLRCDMTGTLSGLWYNPYLGIVRARVPLLQTEYDSVLLYNQLNGSDITALFVVPQPFDAETKARFNAGVIESDAPD